MNNENDKPFSFLDYIPDYLRGLEVKLGGITVKIDDWFSDDICNSEDYPKEVDDGRKEGNE